MSLTSKQKLGEPMCDPYVLFPSAMRLEMFQTEAAPFSLDPRADTCGAELLPTSEGQVMFNVNKQ